MTKFEISTEIKLSGLFAKEPQEAIRIYVEEFRRALNQTSSLIMRDVIRGTPVHQGTAKSSVFRELRGKGLSLHAVVGTPLIYMHVLETSQPPNWPNVDNLRMG